MSEASGYHISLQEGWVPCCVKGAGEKGRAHLLLSPDGVKMGNNTLGLPKPASEISLCKTLGRNTFCDGET